MVNIGSQEREQIASRGKKVAINTSVTAINCCKLWQMPEKKTAKTLTGIFIASTWVTQRLNAIIGYLRYNHILMWGQNTVFMGISDSDFKLNWVNIEILLRMSTLWGGGGVWKHHASLENPFERLLKDNSINTSICHSLMVNKSNDKSWVAQQITHYLQSSWDHTCRILPAVYVCLLKQEYICSHCDCVLNQHAVTAKCVPAPKWRHVCWHA